MKKFAMGVVRNGAIIFLILTICCLILFLISPVFIKPYTIMIEHEGDQVSFMPYTSYRWHVQAGKEGLFIATPSRSDPINVVFTGATRKELEEVFRSLCWSKVNPALYPFSWQRLYKGWESHGPALEFRYVYASNPERGYHIRIFAIGKVNGEDWFAAAAHQEYYDEHAEDHIIISWEGAEQFVKEGIEKIGSAAISATEEINDPFWNEKESDGRATIIDFSDMDFLQFPVCQKKTE